MKARELVEETLSCTNSRVRPGHCFLRSQLALIDAGGDMESSATRLAIPGNRISCLYRKGDCDND